MTNPPAQPAPLDLAQRKIRDEALDNAVLCIDTQAAALEQQRSAADEPSEQYLSYIRAQLIALDVAAQRVRALKSET